MKKAFSPFSLIFVVGVLLTFAPQKASAKVNIEISGNGAGSKNCVIIITNNGNVVKKTTQCATASASVPEFGMIPGIVAAVGSAGSILVLRKRK